jgi:hypothetical protein
MLTPFLLQISLAAKAQQTCRKYLSLFKFLFATNINSFQKRRAGNNKTAVIVTE